MTRLVKTKTEWEGITHDQLSVIEGTTPALWPDDANLIYIGKSQPRIDGQERVSGKAKYTSDIELPGMLYAKVLRSPYPHARIKKIDISKAENLPGVRAVISYKNVPSIPWWNNTNILDTTMRFAGDEVAVVAAEDEYIAEDALNMIRVEYEILPFVLDEEESLKPGSPQIHREGNVVGGRPRYYRRGDVRKGLAEADVVIEEHFRTQAVLHNCMESHGAVAFWEGDVLTVWESTQALWNVQDDLVEAFNIPRNKVRVICEYMGGGFGSKQYSGKWSVLAAVLSRQTGRPVRLLYDRKDENLATGNRSSTIQYLKIGAKKDGTLTAMDFKALINIGALGWSTLSIEGPVQVLYACPNVRTEVTSIFTNTCPARSFRGPGYVEGNFPLESLIDELANRLDIDPIVIRLRNYAKFDQKSGLSYSAKHLDLCYQRGAEIIGWRKPPEKRQNEGRKWRALGMASQIWGGGGGPPAYAWVRINKDGSTEVITGSQDIGTGTRTVMAQIAAEELGVDVSQITVQLGDTGKGPYDPVSWGSMTVSSVGPAVRQAAIDARKQLLDISAVFLDMMPEELELKGGKIYLHGETKALAEISEITSEIGEITILGKGSREPNQRQMEVRTFGAQFADVEVDKLTGEITIHKVVTVHDFGRVINPLGSKGQVEGAVIQGIGFALIENRVIDLKTGVVLNADMDNYLMPTVLDFNDIDYVFINESDNKANSIGAKGLGEPALIPTAPAIANAIARAIDIRFLNLPISRGRVLEGLKNYQNQRMVIR
jgi:CO/xanthine dehydrogenase Mo-binding subunit